jgi:hypothetical protein
VVCEEGAVAWAEFAIFYAEALLGAVAIASYGLRLIAQSGRALEISPRRLLLLSLAQNAALFAIIVALGLLAARAVGLGAPYVGAALGGSRALPWRDADVVDRTRRGGRSVVADD